MLMKEIFEQKQSNQLDELSWKDIQRGAKKISKGAQKFTKNVSDTGAAVGQAFKDVGGSVKQVGKTLVADPLAATYGATKSGLDKAAGVTKGVYKDIRQGLQTGAQGVSTATGDIGRAGKWAGKEIANIAGGAAGAVGATVGGATTGLGRAAAHGFNTGVQNVGGQAVDQMQTNIMKQPGNASTPSWADPSSPDYVGRREAARRQAQSPAPATASGYKSVTMAPPTVTTMKTAPVWTGRKPESKLTPAQYISRIGMDESLSWSKSFDPGMTVWNRMHESK